MPLLKPKTIRSPEMKGTLKISLSYPPLESPKGTPLLAQNRQFQWFKDPTYIYPMIPAFAASLLKQSGHEVFWDDGIAEGLTYQQWLERLSKEQPDIIVIETKTPVVKRHWRIIKEIKQLTTGNWQPRTVLVGDHVTAMPQESMDNCPVDYVITGGDYDFVLGDLCDVLSSDPEPIFEPLAFSSELPKGVWYRENGKINNTGNPDYNHDLNDLPVIDRDLTKWHLYAYKNGNFKYPPGTYTMAGRDCWWGKCTFCSWAALYPGTTYRTFSVERQLKEIGTLIDCYGIREIFDDSGCFPSAMWLEEFCQGVVERGYHKKVVLGCNMRAGALNKEQFRLMKSANFRFILIGLESMNQTSLNRLNKGIKVDQIEETCRIAKKAGLEPHITAMMGYPWETWEDALETINFARKLFKKGYIDSLQATVVVPYPGTPMFEEALNKGWLITEDWDDYDMKRSVWKSPVTNEDVLRFTRDLYKTSLSPAFIVRKVRSIRSIDDIKFLARAVTKVFSHIVDFKGSKIL